jgi:ABC-2 type transport system permease protein
MLLMLSAVIATSLSIVREKERETIEQMMVSPLRPEELILGKTVPYILVCLVTMVMVLGLGYALFGVEVKGSWIALAAATFVFLFAALGMGILISASTKSQQVAFQIAIIASLLPAIILSGFIFPIANMPAPVRALTQLVVPRFYMTALREIILKGASLPAVWPELAHMAALGVLFNLLAAGKTRKSV